MARPLNEYGVTEQQEKFCRVFVETGNASEAYRQSYKSDRKNANTIAVDASRLLDKPNVNRRILMLRETHQKRHAITVDTLLEKLNAVYDAAMDTGEGDVKRPAQAAAATGAIMAQAKLLGLDKQLIEMSGSLNVTLSNSQRAALDKALDDEY